MNNTKIEWCDQTWSPVTGCLHDCPYCYARQMVKRWQGYKAEDGTITTHNPHKTAEQPAVVLTAPLITSSKHGWTRNAPFPFGFDPTLYEYRLTEPAECKQSQDIFVCSMADLFGDWIPDDWITKVFDACQRAPQHRYLFVTKNPARYIGLYQNDKLLMGNNIWYGSTVTSQDEPFMYVDDKSVNTFISIEPILGEFGRKNALKDSGVKLVIIGAETGTRKGKVVPDRIWIENAVDACREAGVSVFLKDSVAPYWDGPLLRQLPWKDAE